MILEKEKSTLMDDSGIGVKRRFGTGCRGTERQRLKN